MQTAWFLSLYRRLPGAQRGRYCAMDDLTPEIGLTGGGWTESEIDGDRAVVLVQSSSRMLNLIGLLHRQLSETEARAAWTYTRRKPFWDERSRTIRFSATQRARCKRLAELPHELPASNRSRELEALTGLWSAVGFGEGWRLSAEEIRRGARSGYAPIQGAAFPTTSILDNFNRANEDPLSDAGRWASPWFSSSGVMQIVSNVAKGTAAITFDDMTRVTAYGPDCEVFSTLVTKSATPGAANWYHGTRIASPGTGSMDCYDFTTEWVAGAGNDISKIVRIDNTVQTVLGATFVQEQVNGDRAGGASIADSHTFYYNGGGGWTALATRGDATYMTTGRIGFGLKESDIELDDFGGGTVVVPLGLGGASMSVIRIKRPVYA
ncbi:MAG: hypothetical protein ACRDGM_00715 [bacterium]